MAAKDPTPETIKAMELIHDNFAVWYPLLSRYADKQLRIRGLLNPIKKETPNGMTGQDLVANVFHKIQYGKRNWDPINHPDLLIVLRGMIKSEAQNMRISVPDDYKEADFFDEQGMISSLVESKCATETNFVSDKVAQAEYESRCGAFLNALLEASANDPDLISYIDLFFNGNKPADIGKTLGKSEKEIDAIRKKMARKVEKLKNEINETKTNGGSK